MSSAVLDASALMALLNHEPGADQLTPDILINAVSSTVNLAEVHGKLVERGLPPDKAWLTSISSIRESVPFTAEHAKIAGDLMAQTRQFALSPGDRACLALALQMKAPVYTADRSWKNLKLNLRIHVIR